MIWAVIYGERFERLDLRIGRWKILVFPPTHPKEKEIQHAPHLTAMSGREMGEMDERRRIEGETILYQMYEVSRNAIEMRNFPV